MGVTLERVQHKFACIIGELCGEPRLLSQFAVWVDLRLAEYKSKGSISLECSGDVPEPSWLEGLTLTSQRPLTSNVGPFPTYSRTHGSSSPGLPFTGLNHMIKTEPVDTPTRPDISARLQPPGLQSPVSGVFDSRKRSHAMSMGGNFRFDLSHSAAKLQKRSSSLPSNSTAQQHGGTAEDQPDRTDTEMAQSIMDNIGRDVSGQSPNGSFLGESPSNKDTMEDFDHAILDSVFLSPTTLPSSRAVESGTKQDDSRDQNDFDSGEMSASRGTNGGFGRGVNSFRSVTGGARCRTHSDLNTFQSWLRSQPNVSPREIQNIPPAELDPLLADFFRTVKNRRGRDYDHNSLKYIRASLERHLKASGYPVSITRSTEFHYSQQVYHTRKSQLRLASLESGNVSPFVNSENN